jgi:hypothetical protein
MWGWLLVVCGLAFNALALGVQPALARVSGPGGCSTGDSGCDVAVPEPSLMLQLGIGLLAVGLLYLYFSRSERARFSNR